MTIVSDEFIARWRQQIETTGAEDYHRRQKPITVAYVRTGRFRRNWRPWSGPDVNAYVVGGNNDEPWAARYAPTSDWIELPNVISCELSKTLDEKVQRATLVVENTLVVEHAGFAGLYHGIERGYLSPWRGTESEFTPPAPVETNDWFQVLDQKLQVKIWQGYGADELVPTFIGFIDDLDMVSAPDQISIIARDPAVQMTDQRFYGWSKERDIPDPVTFADRISSSASTRVGSNADASSNASDADLVLDGDGDTRWTSDNHTTKNNTEWIEIELPAGRYESFRINTMGYSGMEGYISIDSVDGSVDLTPIADGWYDPDSTSVPGVNGGYPFFKNFTTLDGVNVVRLGFSYITDGGAKVRIAFRDLKKKGDDYRAGVTALKGVSIELAAAENTEGWILVDDVSDIVRLVLRWCGFTDWYVEDADMRLKRAYRVTRESFLMEMIEHCVEQTGFEFFIADPTEDDDSLGYPVFRMKRALYEIDADEIPVIREDDLLQRADVAFDTEPLAAIIRVRGTTATKDEGGLVISRDDRRLLAVYFPPWRDDGETPAGQRTAGVITRTFLDRFYLKTQDAVELAARYVALYQALASARAGVQIPAFPAIDLDSHVLLFDNSTGLNTRLWVSSRSSTFTGGDQPSWTMQVGGSLLDTPYMVAMRAEILSFLEGLEEG